MADGGAMDVDGPAPGAPPSLSPLGASPSAALRIGEWEFPGGTTVIYPPAGTLSNSIVRVGRATRLGPGAGAKGTVVVAVKVVALESGREELEAVRREHEVLREIGDAHPHILTMLQFVETPIELVLLTRFAPKGDLSGCIPRNTVVEEEEVRKLSRQLLSALAFLHGRSIVHGDVKPSNIFLTELGGAMTLQLADFGLSRRLPPGQTFVRLCQVQGSHGFIPAEVMHRQELHCASDLFALGVFVFRYLGGYDPFYPASKVTDPLVFDEGCWRHASAAARDFAARALQPEPAARGTARGLLEEHPWTGGPAPAPAAARECRLGPRFHDLEAASALWRRCQGACPGDADAHPGSRAVGYP